MSGEYSTERSAPHSPPGPNGFQCCGPRAQQAAGTKSSGLLPTATSTSTSTTFYQTTARPGHGGPGQLPPRRGREVRHDSTNPNRTPLTDWANIGVRFDSAAAWAPDVGPTGLAMLENKAVISVDQDGVAAGRIVDSGNGQVFSKRESDGDDVIALYNTSATATTTVSVPLSAAGISGSVTATNLWTGASAGSRCRCRGSLAAPVLHRQ
jgi:alpha galactosidase C-like protein